MKLNINPTNSGHSDTKSGHISGTLAFETDAPPIQFKTFCLVKRTAPSMGMGENDFQNEGLLREYLEYGFLLSPKA